VNTVIPTPMRTILVAAAVLIALGTARAAAQPKIETLFEGAVFTEGPAAAPDGSIYFSDITGSSKSREAGHIMRYDPKSGKVTVFRSPSGMANGIMFDLQGRMVVAEGADHGGRRVTRTDMRTGKSERLATAWDGKPLNSPNDLTIDRRGRIYFTDPRYVGAEPVEQPVQAVYRIDPDGSVHQIITDAGKPNGVAVSPDQRTLYVAGTPNPQERLTILAYDLSDDGSARFRNVLVELKSGYADGLTVDRAGNIYCGCGPLGVRVYSPKGDELASVPTPAEATNIEFGRGKGNRMLYITAGGGLYRVRLQAEGFHPAD
jgi:gluconolactonase